MIAMANIELPKDAEGREIPLDTKVLYDQDGNPREVARFAYTLSRDCDKWDVIFVNGYDRYASEMLLEPPDSWSKLEEDLDGCIEKDEVCCYYNKNKDCRSCPISGNNPNGCISEVFKDVKKRIRNLRGVS